MKTSTILSAVKAIVLLCFTLFVALPLLPLLDIANWSLLWAPFGLIRETLRK